MQPDFLRRMARQCRDLIPRTRTEAAREQLRLWIEEFERRAETLEREPATGQDC
jgi:hypothetical protein